MRILIEHDERDTEVYENVTDVALIICQYRPVGDGKSIKLLPLATGRSIFGQYPRELVKEVQAVASELWDRLKELPQHGGS